jgi:hypothetical protein
MATGNRNSATIPPQSRSACERYACPSPIVASGTTVGAQQALGSRHNPFSADSPAAPRRDRLRGTRGPRVDNAGDSP